MVWTSHHPYIYDTCYPSFVQATTLIAFVHVLHMSGQANTLVAIVHRVGKEDGFKKWNQNTDLPKHNSNSCFRNLSYILKNHPYIYGTCYTLVLKIHHPYIYATFYPHMSLEHVTHLTGKDTSLINM
jgi:hypothetical protein